jgi:hypothetical protein
MAARARTCPAAMPSSRASISSGSATFANRYAARRGLARRGQGGPVELLDEVGQREPGQQVGEVRLVEGDGVRDPVAEPLDDLSQ